MNRALASSPVLISSFPSPRFFLSCLSFLSLFPRPLDLACASPGNSTTRAVIGADKTLDAVSQDKLLA
ncbi:hypothetical protein E2C01_094313 [Portunus trituberculatus]|uniref:Uncharacterized protein n=1 Tax=Portunus trituberculatus TaxID=210409 RepID=A0A5B7JX92_PORTR|nr:hypothetical protein [Portunus trituberculatus]